MGWQGDLHLTPAPATPRERGRGGRNPLAGFQEPANPPPPPSHPSSPAYIAGFSQQLENPTFAESSIPPPPHDLKRLFTIDIMWERVLQISKFPNKTDLQFQIADTDSRGFAEPPPPTRPGTLAGRPRQPGSGTCRVRSPRSGPACPESRRPTLRGARRKETAPPRRGASLRHGISKSTKSAT